MSTSYKDIVGQLRTAFPAPVSDRVHDAYFVFSFLRALDQVDALKSAAPMLGAPVTLDYDQARQRRLADAPSTLEAVTSELVQYLSGMFIWGHPRAQINVVPPPTIPSIIGGLLPSIYNPNLVSEESSRQVLLAEVEAIAMTSALVGYDPATADGLSRSAARARCSTRPRLASRRPCPACAARACGSPRSSSVPTAPTTPV
jgi:L-2,4-diaminobutyrate decarboxylase